jgi:hypothetical protein
MVSTRLRPRRCYATSVAVPATCWPHLPTPPAPSVPDTSVGPLPVLELDGPQSMAQPLVQLARPRRLRQPKVGLPAQQVGPQFSTTSSMLRPPERRSCRMRALKFSSGLAATLHLTSCPWPPTTRNPGTCARSARHRALGFVDLKLQAAVQLPEQAITRSLPWLPT